MPPAGSQSVRYAFIVKHAGLLLLPAPVLYCLSSILICLELEAAAKVTDICSALTRKLRWQRMLSWRAAQHAPMVCAGDNS